MLTAIKPPTGGSQQPVLNSKMGASLKTANLADHPNAHHTPHARSGVNRLTIDHRHCFDGERSLRADGSLQVLLNAEDAIAVWTVGQLIRSRHQRANVFNWNRHVTTATGVFHSAAILFLNL